MRGGHVCARESERWNSYVDLLMIPRNVDIGMWGHRNGGRSPVAPSNGAITQDVPGDAPARPYIPMSLLGGASSASASSVSPYREYRPVRRAVSVTGTTNLPLLL